MFFSLTKLKKLPSFAYTAILNYWPGAVLTVLGFFIPWLINQNMPMAILSGAFWLFVYIGYKITDNEDETKTEAFLSFSSRLGIAMVFVSIIEIALKNAEVHRGLLATALAWPLFSMGIVILLLYLIGKIGLELFRYNKAMEMLEEY